MSRPDLSDGAPTRRVISEKSRSFSRLEPVKRLSFDFFGTSFFLGDSEDFEARGGEGIGGVGKSVSGASAMDVLDGVA